MAEPEKPRDLAPSSVDYVVSAAKASLGVVPFVGSLLAEIAGTLIPNQRIDRLTKFATVLEAKVSKIERDFVRSQLSNENFTDLVEEGLRQAARSVTDARREYIASLIAHSLSCQDIEYLESKHLLSILGEINDIEVIWLRFYLNPSTGEDREYREKHQDVLSPIDAHMGSEQGELDKATLQESYKNHLLRLELLAPRYRIDRKTGVPEFDSSSGRMKIQSYALTPLGRLLLQHLDLTAEDEAGS
jgi:hypothetical protein